MDEIHNAKVLKLLERIALALEFFVEEIRRIDDK